MHIGSRSCFEIVYFCLTIRGKLANTFSVLIKNGGSNREIEKFLVTIFFSILPNYGRPNFITAIQYVDKLQRVFNMYILDYFSKFLSFKLKLFLFS